MNDDAEPWMETQEAVSGGWVACLRRGAREIWFAGGPGVGRIGYELANEDAANAAVALEMGKSMNSLTAERAMQLERIVQNGRLGDRVQIISKDVDHASGFKTVSVWLDRRPMGHLVEVNKDEETWFDERASKEIEEARSLARTLGGEGGPGLGGGPGGR